MNLKSVLKAGVVAGLAGGVVLSALSPAVADEDRIRWKMGSAYPSRLVQLGSLGVDLSKNVERISGGTFELKFYEPGALVPALEMFDSIANGSLDAAWSTPGYWFGKEPALALFAAVPFGPSASEYVAWMRHGGGQELMDGIYAKHNIKSLLCGVIAPEASGWFREEVKSLDDLNGKKMRFFGLGAKVMEKFGVSTQLLAGADIYPALERGTIDATEFSMPAIDLDLGFYQVAKHYYFPGWHQQSTLFELMMNKEKWEALSDTHKAQLEVACLANFTMGLAEGEAIQGKALETLKSKGVTIHKWDQASLDRMEKAWEEVAAELAGQNAEFKKTWDSLEAFRKEYAVWKDIGYLN